MRPGKYRVIGRDVPAGLFLIVEEGGARRWQLRYATGGRERWMGLGPLSLVSPSKAVEMARSARLLIREGKDPIDERKASLAQARATVTVTFREAASQFHRHHAKRWSNERDHRQWMKRIEKFALPTMGNFPVAQIDRQTVLRAFAPFWVEGGPVHAASRTLAAVAEVLDFAKSRGWRSGDNPAAWSSALEHDLPRPKAISAPKSLAAMPYADVPMFYGSLGGTVIEAVIKFAILTAARSGEVLGARWAEIGLDKAIWTIPAERMKMRREQTIPLPKAAVELLRTLPHEKHNHFVFIGPKAGAGLRPVAMIAHLKRQGFPYTVHGFRSSFRTWAAEETAYAVT
jgi:integrase